MSQASVYDLYWLSEDNYGLLITFFTNLFDNTFLYFDNVKLFELLILL